MADLRLAPQCLALSVSRLAITRGITQPPAARVADKLLSIACSACAGIANACSGAWARRSSSANPVAVSSARHSRKPGVCRRLIICKRDQRRPAARSELQDRGSVVLLKAERHMRERLIAQSPAHSYDQRFDQRRSAIERHGGPRKIAALFKVRTRAIFGQPCQHIANRLAGKPVFADLLDSQLRAALRGRISAERRNSLVYLHLKDLSSGPAGSRRRRRP